MSGAMPPFLHMPSWHSQEYLSCGSLLYALTPFPNHVNIQCKMLGKHIERQLIKMRKVVRVKKIYSDTVYSFQSAPLVSSCIIQLFTAYSQ
jgi:hypothetical protein